MNDKLHNLTSTAIKLGVPIKWLRKKALAQEVPCLAIKDRLLFNVEAVREKLLELAAKGGGDNGN